MVWGYQGSRMLKIQKKAMRILSISKYNSHSEPLFKKKNILKFYDMLKLHELKFYYKYVHHDLPAYLLNWKIITNAYVHNYNTRKKTELHPFRTEHEFAKRCLRYSLPHVINNTSKLVTEKIGTHSFRSFGNYAKNNLLEKYVDTCTILNCYTCYQSH